jgi:hypothetical protein
MNWQLAAIGIVTGLAVDTVIAFKITGTQPSFWHWFFILAGAPIYSGIKTAAFGVITWLLPARHTLAAHYQSLFSRLDWPKPDTSFEDADAYLERVIATGTTEARIEAAKLHGYLRALHESRQITHALLLSATIKDAMTQYHSDVRFAE